MKVLAIVQARNGSTRLPNKVLLKLAGKAMLEHVVGRVRRCPDVEEVIVATTISPEDLSIVRLCAENDLRVFCGSENDVLDRYYQVAKLIEPEHIVRVTGDCPLMDPAVISKVLESHLSSCAAYTSNVQVPTYPDGEDVEIVTYAALQRAWKEARLVSEREHVTPYIRNHREIFPQTDVLSAVDYSAKRWTLDNPEDFDFLTRIYDALYPKDPWFGMEEVLVFLRMNPHLEAINASIQRNEGLAKSLREDRVISKEDV